MDPNYEPPGGFPWENFGFTPLQSPPATIKWGLEVPEETQKASYAWVLYDIASEIDKEQPIDSTLLSHAITNMYFNKFAFCNKLWHKYEAPCWVEAVDMYDDSFVFEIRTSFFKNVIRPILNYLESLPLNRRHVEPRVWKYKKKLIRSNCIKRHFSGLETSLKRPLSWQQRLGSNIKLLGFKCGNVYDTKTGEFCLGKALCLRRIRIELA
jgi:hypothetical protein